MELNKTEQTIAVKKSPASRVRKKADDKLEIVAETFQKVAGSHWEKTTKELFFRRLEFCSFHYIPFLDLRYNCENRFFSISYNLELSTEISADKEIDDNKKYEFILHQKNTMHGKVAEWKCKIGGDEKECKKYVERLNHPLIEKRVIALEMIRANACYNPKSKKWRISCETMIGSTTWLLLPPVTDLIKPHPDECVKAIEFFELVADALVNSEKE